jgi:hypothetical protein
MDRRDFCWQPRLPTCTRPAAAAKVPDGGELTLSDIAAAFSVGRLTSQRLTQTYLDRIDRIDRRGPKLAAVLEINPRALEIAAELDRERQARGPRGPLHGVPVLPKDNVETADRMMTTAGSLALEGWYSPTDASLAARLRAAGAVILGKTNLSEWANFRSTHSSSGWSGRGGQTEILRTGSNTVRIELRIGGRGGRQPVRRCGGHRDRRLDRQSGFGQRHSRLEATVSSSAGPEWCRYRTVKTPRDPWPGPCVTPRCCSA